MKPKTSRRASTTVRKLCRSPRAMSSALSVPSLMYTTNFPSSRSATFTLARLIRISMLPIIEAFLSRPVNRVLSVAIPRGPAAYRSGTKLYQRLLDPPMYESLVGATPLQVAIRATIH